MLFGVNNISVGFVLLLVLLDHIIFNLEKSPEERGIRDGKRIGQF